MTRIVKTAAAVVLAGGLTAAVASPSLAQSGRTAAAAGIGFAAGAALGAAATGGFYGPGYYAPPAYPYAGYAQGPVYYNYSSRCLSDEGYGRTSSCDR